MRLLLAFSCAIYALMLIGCSDNPAPTDLVDAAVLGTGDASSGDAAVVDDAAAEEDDAGPNNLDAGVAVPKETLPPTGSPVMVVVGSWGLRASVAGDAWTFCSNAQREDDHSPDLLRAISYGDGVFVAVGGDANSMVMRSVDGVRWEEDLHPTNNCSDEVFPASCTNWMGGVAYGDGIWLAGGGNGALMRSSDHAKTWSAVRVKDRMPAIRTLRYGDGRFVAAADGGQILVSADEGATWKVETLWTSTFSGLVYGEGLFIAYGQAWIGGAWQQACYLGKDQAASWSPCPEALQGASAFAYDGDRWIALHRAGYLASEDGETWVDYPVAEMPQELTALLHVQDEGYYARRGSTLLFSRDLTLWETVAGDFSGVRNWVQGLVLDTAPLSIEADACADGRQSVP